MAGGFLSRFRRHAETPPAKPDEMELSSGEAAPAMPDKLTSPELNGEGNDVAIETLALSHEGLELEGEDAAGLDVKYTMFDADGTPVAAEGDAPAFQDALITETALPKLDAGDPSPDPAPDGPDGLASDGQDGGGESNFFEAWPAKWYVPELDSDSSASLPHIDPDEETTLQPIAESPQADGGITSLAAATETEPGPTNDDPDVDDLI
jgi:hypothetical protein